MTYHPIVKGAIELHCHSYPSIFPRSQNDWQLINDVKEANMGGVVLKAHEASTVDRSTLLRLKNPDLHIYGGLVLNEFTGGLSPQTVDAAIRQGAKIIWMPTISSNQHCCHFNQGNTRLFQSKNPLPNQTKGLTIWNDQNDIIPEVHEILKLIAQANITLATGHLSFQEVQALLPLAKEYGVEKVLIQHADLGIAPVPMDVQKDFAQSGAIIEKCYLACSDDFKDVTIQEMAYSIRKVGAESCVLVTDYGQDYNIPPIQAFNKFVEEMLGEGITENEIEMMIVHNPRRLLGL